MYIHAVTLNIPKEGAGGGAAGGGGLGRPGGGPPLMPCSCRGCNKGAA